MIVPHRKAVAAIPALGICFLQWFYAIFVLNRYRGITRFNRPEMVSLILHVIGGFSLWISEMCLLDANMFDLQIVSSTFRTVITWFGFVLIVNERLFFTWQQIGSLLICVAIAILWDVMHQIILL